MVAIQRGRPMRVRWGPAVAAYAALGMVLALVTLARPPFAFAYAFAAGIATYGVYNATTAALLDAYPIGLALQDTLWGGVVVGTSTWLATRVLPS